MNIRWTLFLWVACVKQSSAGEQDCGRIDFSANRKAAKGSKTQNRIINGYDVLVDRPWMVRVRAGSLACTGSLISSRLVVTAAHCVCSKTAGKGLIKCGQEEYGKTKEIKQDLLPNITLWLSNEDHTKPPTVKVVRAAVYATYRSEVEPSPYDILLLTVAEPVVFTSSRMPICLPTEDTLDLGIVVYSAGWGNLRTSDTCLTDQYGPSQFSKCASAEELPCTQTALPPITETCKEFFQAVSPPKTMQIFQVENEVCYKPEAAFGWCYTDQECKWFST